MEVLSKDKIEAFIVPHLSSGSLGSEVRVELWRIVSLILYRLKTGCQWRMLPLKEFFEGQNKLGWQGVYYHSRQWVRDGSFKKAWIALLKAHQDLLDLSSRQLDGSHTPAKNGGEQVGYQGRQKAKTTNGLFLCDNEGQPLAIATPQSGESHDLYAIETLFAELCSLLTEAGITLNGVFMKADSGFDAIILQNLCSEKGIEANIDRNEKNTKEQSPYRYFDEELYKRRFVVERMNAWIGGFKALLVRFETKVTHWLHLHYLAFSVLLIRKKDKC